MSFITMPEHIELSFLLLVVVICLSLRLVILELKIHQFRKEYRDNEIEYLKQRIKKIDNQYEKLHAKIIKDKEELENLITQKVKNKNE